MWPPGPLALAGHLRDDRLQRRLDLVVGHARARKSGGCVGEQRIDVDDVAGRDAQHRLRLGPVIAVGDGRRRGRQAHGLGFACTADGETTQEGGRCSQLMGFPHDGYGSTTRRPLGPTLRTCTHLVPGRNQAAPTSGVGSLNLRTGNIRTMATLLCVAVASRKVAPANHRESSRRGQGPLCICNRRAARATRPAAVAAAPPRRFLRSAALPRHWLARRVRVINVTVCRSSQTCWPLGADMRV